MTTIVVYEDTGRSAPLEATDDPAAIQCLLAVACVGFERQNATLSLPADAAQDFILRAYAETIERLRRTCGYQSADVFRLAPNSANREAIRAQFLAEHTHNDDEVRFVVEGGGRPDGSAGAFTGDSIVDRLVPAPA